MRRVGATLSLSVMGVPVLPGQEAQQVHQAVAEDYAAQLGPYSPLALTAHEFATLGALADRIIPADGRSPGALEAGAARFIDFLCAARAELRDIITGGLAWLNHEMRRRYEGKDFLNATLEQQTEMLDLIAFDKNHSPELNPGIRFFQWARRLVADAYYTSPIGIQELGYVGNSAMPEFQVPREAVEFARKRTP
ncbi:MAG TPA: gluconate 2-dehydrogenase subunit 3 family protein [Bryobacteraceae bacterium]|nr:gluconate 2-dehydrogenase subunit 3 family protein [Bryobacteraceae bacterium]